jgi:hypothetical protein
MHCVLKDRCLHAVLRVHSGLAVVSVHGLQEAHSVMLQHLHLLIASVTAILVNLPYSLITVAHCSASVHLYE